MINRYSNQNHNINRSFRGFEKVASIYDKQSESNRVSVDEPLKFSSLAPYESEAIMSQMDKDASSLQHLKLEKEARSPENPFDVFSQAKNYLATKLGLSDGMAHDLASNVVTKAETLHNHHGGELRDMIVGIVDNMDANELQQNTGAIPMKPISTAQIQEEVKTKLMDGLQISSFEADRLKMNVMQQTKNLSVQLRLYSTQQIAHAIANVIIEHQDPSIVYDISNSQRLIEEVKYQLQSSH